MAICWIPRTRNGRLVVLRVHDGDVAMASPTTDIHESRHHGGMPSVAGDRPGDLSWASFTDEAPWEVERNDVRWLNLAVTLRRQAQAEVPALTQAVAPAAGSASRVGRRHA